MEGSYVNERGLVEQPTPRKKGFHMDTGETA